MSVATIAASVMGQPGEGASVPVEETAGDTILAGTINRAGALEARTTKVFTENTVARITILRQRFPDCR